MKKILFSFLLFPCLNYAQDSSAHKPKTKLEELSTAVGRIIKKDYVLIDQVRQLKISTLKLTDLKTEETTSGIYLSAIQGGAFTGPLSSSTSFIDKDEIPGFVSFLEYISQIIEVPKNDEEYTYYTKGDFKCYLFNYNNDWVFGMQLNYLSSSTVAFKYKDLQQVLADFKKAESVL